MEGITTTEAKKAEKPEEFGKNTEHSEAVAFVERHRDYFEHYAGGRIKIAPAPEGLKTFAFDLEKNTIYINGMFYKQFGFPEQKTIFATCHEIEHFLEKIQILGEVGGEKEFERFIKKIKSSRAFSLMDNCVADIHINKTVVSRRPAMGELEGNIYKEDLFPIADFTKQPRHIQFCQAILREARVPDEKCLVSTEVRNALDELAKIKSKTGTELIQVMTDPQTPMSVRLKLQDKYIWPKVEVLMEKDMEDKKEEQKKQSEKQSEKGEGKEENDEGQGEEAPEEKEGEPNEEDGDKSEGKKQKPEKGESSNKTREKEEGESGGEETDPDKIFADEYTEAEKKFSEAVPVEEIEKTLKEWKEEKQKNNPDKIDQDYADKIGVEKKDLQEYRKVAESLEKIVNPETNVSVLEELRNLFSRIISKRIKPRQSPRYPVEEGDELSDPAQLVSDVKSGNLNPKVWEDTEIKEKKGDKFGEIEITLICDRSSSMTDGDGQKAVEQRKSAVLIMEVLKDFAEMSDEEKMNVDKPLEIKSEIYSFASSEEDKTPLKKMSKELGEVERINVLKKLQSLPGSTTDFNCLEAINSALDEKTKQKIRESELKKIVFVFTDGGSDNVGRVQTALKNLRDVGVVVIGVGLTRAGEPARTTYAPNAQVVENVTSLPIILGELLKEHLKDI
ncbi:MAG: VWA domain-containing protein [Minisyncoccia bacterium]